MKVFISWSGNTSGEIAKILSKWLPSVIQTVKTYFTPDDIEKGTRWNPEISKELEESKIGIICLTRDNLESPWIMFEAGALSKNIDVSKVCPILFGINTSDIKGPLVQFQAARFGKDEMKKVLEMINKTLGDRCLDLGVIETTFEMCWPKLEIEIEKVMGNARKTNKPIRPQQEMIAEILDIVRSITSSMAKLDEKVVDRPKGAPGRPTPPAPPSAHSGAAVKPPPPKTSPAPPPAHSGAAVKPPPPKTSPAHNGAAKNPTSSVTQKSSDKPSIPTTPSTKKSSKKQ